MKDTPVIILSSDGSLSEGNTFNVICLQGSPRKVRYMNMAKDSLNVYISDLGGSLSGLKTGNYGALWSKETPYGENKNWENDAMLSRDYHEKQLVSEGLELVTQATGEAIAVAARPKKELPLRSYLAFSQFVTEIAKTANILIFYRRDMNSIVDDALCRELIQTPLTPTTPPSFERRAITRPHLREAKQAVQAEEDDPSCVITDLLG